MTGDCRCGLTRRKDAEARCNNKRTVAGNGSRKAKIRTGNQTVFSGSRERPALFRKEY
jgi:hypothetical protein